VRQAVAAARLRHDPTRGRLSLGIELLYLDQNYLSGIVKRKVAFRELEPVLRAAVARTAVAVPESESHRLESAARPDLPLLALAREFSGGLTLPHERGAVERNCERRLAASTRAETRGRSAGWVARSALRRPRVVCCCSLETRTIRCGRETNSRPRKEQSRPARAEPGVPDRGEGNCGRGRERLSRTGWGVAVRRC
jgi:hypothetical protein